LKRVIFLLSVLLICIDILQAQSSSLLILSEVMFNPKAGNNEYVEIFNKSYTQSIDLNRYRVQYYNNSQDTIASFGFGTVLPPRSYAVILENDYDLQTGVYHNKIPSTALILRITHNVFGLSGMSNSTDHPIRILNTQNDTLDTYIYHADNDSGYSDEKMYLEGDNTVWGNSLALNGTPGGINSNSKLLYDVKISSLNITPELPLPNSYAELKTTIKNIGIRQANSYSVEIYDDKNLDTIPSPNELIFNNSYLNLAPDDSLALSTQVYLPDDRNYSLIVKVLYPDDQDTNNNIAGIKFHTSTLNNSQAVVINEIMYAPVNNEPEWIEIYNRKDYSINIKGWKISEGTNDIVISNSDYILPPKNYLVLCKDSLLKNFYNYPFAIKTVNLFALNNSGNKIIIKDNNNGTVDSVNYHSVWGGSQGKSLERIYPDSLSNSSANWATSLSTKNGTPGLVNSVMPKNYDLQLKTFSFSRNFVIQGEQAHGSVLVTNKGLNYTSGYNINIYYDSNKDSIARLSEKIITIPGSPLNQNESKQYTFITGHYTEGLNYFIAKIEFEYDADTSNNSGYTHITAVTPSFERNDLVINEVMYNPGSEEKSEWVEIYNKSNKSINLCNFKIADSRDTAVVINKNMEIVPSAYIVVARDSSFLSQYHIPNVIIGNFPQLNNDNDKVILIDSLNRSIDSLRYNYKWGGSPGYSLERFSYDAPANDSTNWKSSIYPGGTPESKNSIMQKDYDAGIKLFNYAIKDSLLLITSVIKNYGKNAIDCGVKIYEDNNLDSLEENEIAAYNFNIAVKDSSVISYSCRLPIVKKGFVVKIISQLDEDPQNNRNYLVVNPSLRYNALVINEIMFSPDYNHPEWIELYNNTNDSLSLAGIKISDRAYNNCILSNGVAAPYSYVVITKDSSINNYYSIQKEKLVFSDLPIFNNDKELITLKDKYDHLIDSVCYDFRADTINGRSLERFDTKASGTLSGNWSLSESRYKGTPGKINSISIKDYDLELSTIKYSPEKPIINSAIKLEALVTNKGKQRAGNFAVRFYVDMDNDSIPELLLNSQTFSGLDTAGSVSVKSSNDFVLTGTKCIKAEVIFTADEYDDNNILTKIISPTTNAGSVIINEIMCNPLLNKQKWIELYSKPFDKGNGIDISNWLITINNKKYNLTSESHYLSSGYYVLANDTLFGSLYPEVKNILYLKYNDIPVQGDKIILEDQYGHIIDSISYYSKDVKFKGLSIERRNDKNIWHNSINKKGCTPGEENSINACTSSTSNIIVNEIMFEPGADNNQFVEIYNAGPDTVNLAGYDFISVNDTNVPLRLTEMYLPPDKYYMFNADTLSTHKYKLENYLYESEKEIEYEIPKSEGFIVLKDFTGATVDSVYYSKNYHKKNLTSTKNRSLERINPLLPATDNNNWSSSADPEGATPGKLNSINLNNKNQSAKINIQPNPFSPDNDGFEDFTEISYNLAQPAGNIVLRIFDNTGRLVRTINTGRTSPASGSIIYDGLDDNGKALRIGIYILLLEASNLNGGSNETIKTVFVIARKL